MKALFHLFVSLVLFTLIPAANAASFPDIASPSLRTQAEYLSSKGIISGYPDGTFQPSRVINRAEALKIIFESRGIGVSSDTASGFPDVDRNQWFAKYVTMAKSLGLIQGFPDGTYRPNEPVKVVEFIKIAMLAQQYYSTQTDYSGALVQYTDLNQAEWYMPYVAFALKKDFLARSSRLKPASGLTRGDAAFIVYRIAKHNEEMVAGSDTQDKVVIEASEVESCETCVRGVDIAKEFPEFYNHELVEVKGGEITIYDRIFLNTVIRERSLTSAIWSGEMRMAIVETPMAEKVRIVDEQYQDEYQRIMDITGGPWGEVGTFLSTPTFEVFLQGGKSYHSCAADVRSENDECALEKDFIGGFNDLETNMKFYDFRETDAAKVLLFDIIQDLEYQLKVHELNQS